MHYALRDLFRRRHSGSQATPIAIALHRQDDVDDARVTKNETLVRRGKKWFRYDAPDKRLFKHLQKTLIAPAKIRGRKNCGRRNAPD